MNHFQIKCFLEIVKEKSFTKAADKLFITQPAISRYIAAFEKELGASLFIRSNKLVKLTEAGELYYHLFRKFQIEFHNVEMKVNELKSHHQKNIRFGYMAGWSVSTFLPNILKSFSNKFGDISVTVECLEIDDLVQGLITNKLDVILVIDDCVNGNIAISSQEITEIQMLILFSSFHKLSSKENLTPLDFKDETFYIIQNNRLHTLDDEVRKYCKPYGFVPNLKQVQSTESVLASVENGLGVTVLDEWGRNKHSSSFKHILLDSKHRISMAWSKADKNETIESLVNEVQLFFQQ